MHNHRSDTRIGQWDRIEPRNKPMHIRVINLQQRTPIYVGKVKVTNTKEVYEISIDSEDKKGMGVAAEFNGELEVII